MSKHIQWKDLKIGMLAFVALIAMAVGVLTFGRVGTLHGKTFRVYVTSDAARGVIRGTEVWLDGQKVGLVKNVSFQPPTTSPKDRIVIALNVLESSHQHVRKDSQIQIRAGGSVIGDQVVYINSGTARMQQVADGDTIHSTDQVDYEGTSAEAAQATKEFPGIIENVKLLSAQLKSVNGTLGALGVDGGGPEMQRVRARASRLMTRLSEGDGTVPMMVSHRDLLMARARRAMAQTDSIRALLASNDHSLGRFRRDTTIKAEVTRLRAELADLQREAVNPNGTIGRLRSDSAIVMAIHHDLAALDSLIADMKKHPLRYNPF
jgi:hypothetical protein